MTSEQRDTERPDDERTMVATSPPGRERLATHVPADRERVSARASAASEAVEPALTWRHVSPLPTPAVIDTIRELAADYGLRDGPHADVVRLFAEDRDRAASVVVTVRPLDERTEVVVRVHPLARPDAIDSARQFDFRLAVWVLVAVLVLASCGLTWVHPAAVLLTGPFAVVLTLAVVAVLHRLDAARRSRHAAALEAWGETWQRGFFTALAARLAPTHLYR